MTHRRSSQAGVAGPRADFWRQWLVAGALSLLSIAFFSHLRAETVRASFYGAESGRRTASGAPFNPTGMTLAHRTLPFGTKVRVCFTACAICTVNDRGPFVAGRSADLARGCARAIGLERVGVGLITFDRLN